MTKAEGKRHMARVAALGCIVCKNNGYEGTPAHVHHIDCATMGRRSEDDETIPLCPIHHLDGDGTSNSGGEIAVHRGLGSFEARYGTERELLEQVRRELGIGA